MLMLSILESKKSSGRSRWIDTTQGENMGLESQLEELVFWRFGFRHPRKCIFLKNIQMNKID